MEWLNAYGCSGKSAAARCGGARAKMQLPNSVASDFRNFSSTPQAMEPTRAPGSTAASKRRPRTRRCCPTPCCSLRCSASALSVAAPAQGLDPPLQLAELRVVLLQMPLNLLKVALRGDALLNQRARHRAPHELRQCLLVHHGRSTGAPNPIGGGGAQGMPDTTLTQVFPQPTLFLLSQRATGRPRDRMAT